MVAVKHQFNSGNKTLLLFLSTPCLFNQEAAKSAALVELQNFREKEGINSAILLATPEVLMHARKLGNFLGISQMAVESSDNLDTSCYNEMYQFFQSTLKKHYSMISQSTNYFLLGTATTVTDSCFMLFAMSPNLKTEVFQLHQKNKDAVIQKVFLPNPSQLSSLTDKRWLEIKQMQKEFSVQVD